MNKNGYILLAGALILSATIFWVNTRHSGTQETPDGGVTAPGVRKPTARQPSSAKKAPNRFTPLVDPSIKWQLRVDMLRRLDATSLNQTEIDYLYSLLDHKVNSRQNESWWVVLNEVMEQMQKQSIEPERFDAAMLAIIADDTRHAVVRDYAVQHIAISLKSTDRADALDRIPVIVDALAEQIASTQSQHTTITGTAMLALVDASHTEEVKPAVDAAFDKLENVLTPIISGESAAKPIDAC